MSGPPDTSSSRVDLYFRAEHLPDKDTMSKSDPYLVLYAVTANNQGRPVLAEAGRTETLQNNLNPKWARQAAVSFFFESKQEFRFVVYDYDGHKDDSKNDRLVEGSFLLAHVMGSKGHTLKVPIPGGASVVYISALEVNNSAGDIVSLGFSGQKLKKMDTFGLSDPYFVLYRILPNGDKQKLCKSECIKNTLDPQWQRCPNFTLSQLAGANMEEVTLEFECFDEDTFSDDYIGTLRCSFAQLLKSKTQALLLHRPNKEKCYGEILCDVRVQHMPTFPELLAGGLEINLAVSVDFTGSNGDPRNPTSLHYWNPQTPNQYASAIMSVGEILMQYDADKMVPAFGFGAHLPSGSVSHFFHLNLQENPYVHDVNGILQAYQYCLSQVHLSGPTNFAPTISSVTQGARNTQNVYTVLLILTDGEITDMQQTVDAIVTADSAPISVIIVGVGAGCDFTMMNQLDADETGGLTSSGGVKARRDLVQFVPFRNFLTAPRFALAAEVLREVPAQVVRWAQLTGYKPPHQTQTGPPAPQVEAVKPPLDLA